MDGILLSDAEEESGEEGVDSELKEEEIEKMLKEEKESRKKLPRKREAPVQAEKADKKKVKPAASPAKKAEEPTPVPAPKPVEVEVIAAPTPAPAAPVEKKQQAGKKAKATQADKKVVSSASAGVKGKQSVVGKKSGKKAGKN